MKSRHRATVKNTLKIIKNREENNVESAKICKNMCFFGVFGSFWTQIWKDVDQKSHIKLEGNSRQVPTTPWTQWTICANWRKTISWWKLMEIGVILVILGWNLRWQYWKHRFFFWILYITKKGKQQRQHIKTCVFQCFWHFLWTQKSIILKTNWENWQVPKFLQYLEHNDPSIALNTIWIKTFFWVETDRIVKWWLFYVILIFFGAHGEEGVEKFRPLSTVPTLYPHIHICTEYIQYISPFTEAL